MAIITYGDLSTRVGVFAVQEALARAASVEVLAKMGQTQKIPPNRGRVIKYRRLVPFTAALTPLTEGVTPPSNNFATENVEVTIQQYGDWSELTDVIADLSEDPVLADMTALHGENIGRTHEALIWGAIQGTTSVFYANGVATGDVNTPVTKNLQRKVVRSLKAQKARKVSRILSGSEDYSTEPVEAAYICVAHTNLESDIRNMEGFLPVAKYGTRSPLCPEEIGAVEDVRYILSPDIAELANAGGAATGGSGAMVSTGGTSADVYPMLYFGQDAYGVPALRGVNAMELKVRNPGAPSDSDPLGQRGSVGWKSYFAPLILNDSWIIKVMAAASDL